jgi:hypothetical protein
MMRIRPIRIHNTAFNTIFLSGDKCDKWIRIRIRIQGFDDQEKQQKYSWKFFSQKLQFTYPEASKLQEKPPTIKKEHPAHQNMKLITFCG